MTTKPEPTVKGLNVTSTSTAVTTVQILTTSGTVMILSYATMPGNAPSTNNNTVFLWQSHDAVLYKQTPISSAPVPGATQSGSMAMSNIVLQPNTAYDRLCRWRDCRECLFVVVDFRGRQDRQFLVAGLGAAGWHLAECCARQLPHADRQSAAGGGTMGRHLDGRLRSLYGRAYFAAAHHQQRRIRSAGAARPAGARHDLHYRLLHGNGADHARRVVHVYDHELVAHGQPGGRVTNVRPPRGERQ